MQFVVKKKVFTFREGPSEARLRSGDAPTIGMFWDLFPQFSDSDHIQRRAVGTHTPCMSFDHVPVEIIHFVLEYLAASDLAAIRLVNRRLKVQRGLQTD